MLQRNGPRSRQLDQLPLRVSGWPTVADRWEEFRGLQDGHLKAYLFMALKNLCAQYSPVAASSYIGTNMLNIDEGAMLLTLSPDPPLSSVVECIWHHEGTSGVNGQEHVLPDARFQIVLNLDAGKGAFCGLRSQHVVIDPARIPWMMGVVFRPGGALGLLEASALEFWNRSVALDLVWGSQATPIVDQLRDAGSADKRLRILEVALTNRMHRSKRAIHPAVNYALQVFNNAPNVSTVADVSMGIGWSRRWFSHAFSEQVGMTPKRYCRLMRFCNVARQIASNQPVDWVGVALSGGFYDQAHLTHEFRAFSGLSPERYLRAEHPFPNHVRIE